MKFQFRFYFKENSQVLAKNPEICIKLGNPSKILIFNYTNSFKMLYYIFICSGVNCLF